MTGSPATLRGADVEVLVPTYDRAESLAVTLTSLAGQHVLPGRVVVSDQGRAAAALTSPLVAAVARVLRHRGVPVELRHHPTGAGVTENRQSLLAASRAPYLLYLDDDILLEPEGLARMVAAMNRLRCGFVGMAMTGLSHEDDVREHELLAFEPLDPNVPVAAERVRKGTGGWDRWRLHNAANPTHLGQRAGLPSRGAEWLAYKVAWVAGCVLFERRALLDVGGFEFWPQLGPGGYGEDVVAQLRVMELAGGVGLLPTSANHLELPSTLATRDVDAYETVLATAD